MLLVTVNFSFLDLIQPMDAITNTDIISIGIPVLEFQPGTVWLPKRLL